MSARNKKNKRCTMAIRKTDVRIPVDNSFIHGDLGLHPGSKGIIIFAHGSGSSRFSSRNQFVADVLHQADFSTFLFDLLTKDEERIDVHTREFRFDIPLLAKRLIAVTQWIRTEKKPQLCL